MRRAGRSGAQIRHQFFLLLQLLQHSLERAGQLADLVMRPNIDVTGVLSFRCTPREVHETPNRPRDLPGNDQRRRERQDQPDAECHDDRLL